jgi:hypothetical protein
MSTGHPSSEQIWQQGQPYTWNVQDVPLAERGGIYLQGGQSATLLIGHTVLAERTRLVIGHVDFDPWNRTGGLDLVDRYRKDFTKVGAIAGSFMLAHLVTDMVQYEELHDSGLLGIETDATQIMTNSLITSEIKPYLFVPFRGIDRYDTLKGYTAEIEQGPDLNPPVTRVMMPRPFPDWE